MDHQKHIMRNIFYSVISIVILFNNNVIFAQTATQPSGLGTAASPYLIASLNNLYWVTQNTSSWESYFRQTADIDASASSGWNGGSGFTTIGNAGVSVFSGNYDGDGYTINGVYINMGTSQYAAVFGVIWGAEIKNLGVTNVDVTGGNATGAIVGMGIGSTIQNCYSTGTVQGDSLVGGIVGYAWAMGNINSSVPVNMTGCYSSVAVTGNTKCGGLIGYSQGTEFNSEGFNIVNSYFESPGSVKSNGRAGGITAVLTYGKITQCYSTGSLVSVNASGGLVGENNNSIITNSYVKGSILNFMDAGVYLVGGLVGYNSGGTINNSYAVAWLLFDSGYDPTVRYIGGLVGVNTNAGVITNSFWDVTFSGLTYSAGGTGKTSTQMKTNSTFLNAGWDPSVWNIDGSINNGYPYLSWKNQSGTPLPVELTLFNATVTETAVELTWQTATEVNNYGFEVERSVGQTISLSDEEWETIGFVAGSGNSSSPKIYEFTDEQPPAGNLQYRLKQIDTDGSYEYYATTTSVNNSITNIKDPSADGPTEFSLSQNYPNPFNPTTLIKYTVPVETQYIASLQQVSLKIYDTLGRGVATLVNEFQTAGKYEVEFDGSGLSSGTYLYQLRAGEFVQTKKLLLLK